MTTAIRSLVNPRAPPIPDHELLRRIGGGSYGEVWLARNVVGTLRAVKIVHRHTFENERPYEREYAGIQKFEPISRSHEGFVDILQIGRNDAAACFYYVMELADAAEPPVPSSEFRVSSSTPASAAPQPGTRNSEPETYSPRTLHSEIARRTRLPFDECVALGLSLARALAHLHEQGLVHRDIKPSNIIFVGGVPKLADIGLVADVGEARSYVGTEGFIPPEGPGRPAADLFSLGKVLYEASTGKDRQDFPEPLTNLGDQPDKDRLLELNAILHRACQSDPRARYQSAGEMLAELELLQRGESVKQKRVVERRAFLIKRIAFAFLVLSVLGASGGFFSQRRFEQQRFRRQQAQELCTKGWAAVLTETKDGISQGINYFNRAIELDPKCAGAYCGLADGNMIASEFLLPPKQAMTEVKKNAQKAVEIDDSGDGHMYVGLGKMLYDYDWLGAEQELKRAVALDRKDGSGSLSVYARFLRAMGRFDEARLQQQKAYELAPLNFFVNRDVAWQLYDERGYEQAIAQGRKLLQMNSNSVMGHIVLGASCVRAGKFDEGMSEIQVARAMDDGPDVIGMMGNLYGVAGRLEEAEKLLRKLGELSENRYVSAYHKAMIHAGLGDTNRAMDCLQRAYEERCSRLAWLKIDASMDGLRSDPRFITLLRKMGLE